MAPASARTLFPALWITSTGYFLSLTFQPLMSFCMLLQHFSFQITCALLQHLHTRLPECQSGCLPALVVFVQVATTTRPSGSGNDDQLLSSDSEEPGPQDATPKDALVAGANANLQSSSGPSWLTWTVLTTGPKPIQLHWSSVDCLPT